MNDNSVRLSDSKFIKTVQKNILRETTHCFKGPELLKTGILFTGRVFWQENAVLYGIIWRQQ